MWKVPRSKVYFSPSVWWTAALAILRNRFYEGPETERFLTDFARAVGRRHAIPTASGRQAFLLALKAFGAKAGDEVILPAYTCRVVVASAMMLGLKPVFVDVRPGTYNMDEDKIEAALTPRTRFLLMTHIHGRPMDVDRVRAIAERHGIRVIEDACDVLGARVGGRPLGSFGDVSFFSFSLYKNLNALGGGIALTDDDATAARMREALADLKPEPPTRLRLLGRILFSCVTSFLTHPKVFTFTGFPVIYVLDRFGLDKILAERLVRLEDEQVLPKGRPREYYESFANLQAAVGLAQLRILERDNGIRIRNARVLTSLLAGSGVRAPDPTNDSVEEVFFNYVVRVPDPERAVSGLLGFGVDSFPGYLECLPELAVFRDHRSPCPNAAELVRTKLYLPVHPPLTERDMRKVGEALRQLYPSGGPLAADGAAR